MKVRYLLALATFALGNCALAQNATVFGRVDIGLQRIDMDGATRTGLDSGIYTSSRLGFRGAEDLGGGLSAVYHLEMGIGADAGTVGAGHRVFNRGSFVGLTDSALGTVTLGRQYTPLFWPFLNADEAGPLRLHGYSAVSAIERTNLLRVNQSALSTPATNGPLASESNGIFAAGIASSHEDNQIVYKTPSMAGFTVSLSAAPSENYDGGATKLYGGNLEYSSGPLYLGSGVNRKYGRVPGTDDLQRSDEVLLSGMYAFTESFKLWGNLHGWKVDPGTGTTLKGHDYMLGASWWVGVGQLWANYARKHVNACRECDSDGFGVGYNHFLSKRTELYVAYGRVGNQANAAIGLVGYTPIEPGGTVQGLAAGIAHVF